MVILVENKTVKKLTEGTWAIPDPGQELKDEIIKTALDNNGWLR